LAVRNGESPPAPRVVVRVGLRADMTELPLQEPEPVHTTDSYRRILGTGPPVIKPPGPGDLADVVEASYALPDLPRSLSEWIDEAARYMAGRQPRERVKSALLVMVSADLFARTPIAAPLREQRLKRRDEYPSADACVERIRHGARTKLARVLHSVDEAVLDEIVPRSRGVTISGAT
jgi:hypothetical protein